MNGTTLRRLIAVVVVAIGAGVAVWLLLIRNGDDSSAGTKPAAASVAQLRQVAASVGHPVYWAGSLPAFTYELTRTADGRVYIRYLGPGAKIGDPRPGYLTVGTYPLANALAVTKGIGHKPGEEVLAVPGNGTAVIGREQPRRAYLAFPGSDVQVEVFSPAADITRRTVTKGLVRPIR